VAAPGEEQARLLPVQQQDHWQQQVRDLVDAPRLDPDLAAVGLGDAREAGRLQRALVRNARGERVLAAGRAEDAEKLTERGEQRIRQRGRERRTTARGGGAGGGRGRRCWPGRGRYRLARADD